MTINELREKKKALDNKLIGLIQDFENETGITVTGIKVGTVKGEAQGYCYTDFFRIIETEIRV